MFGLKRDRAKTCQIVHELPGRVRIYCPGLRHLPKEALAIATRLGALPGVRSAKVSPITENVLIHFDQAKSGTPRYPRSRTVDSQRVFPNRLQGGTGSWPHNRQRRNAVCRRSPWAKSCRA